MESNRTLPHNLEAEKAVLGALIMSPGSWPQAAQILKPDHFFRMAHRMLFAAMAHLVDEKRTAIDYLTLVDEIRRRGEMEECGGPAYISALTDGMARATNITHYAVIVKENATLRSLIYMANDLLGDAYDAEKPAEELLNNADKALIDLQRGANDGRMIDLRTSTSALYGDLEWRIAHQGELTGIETGFESINRMTLGWQPGDMIVLAARPSIGKTAFTLNTAVSAARAGKRVAIFSLEMRRKQLENRLLATLSGVELTRIMGGHLGDADLVKLGETMSELASLPIFVNDRGGQTIWDMRAAARRLRAEGGLDLIIIDYVQLMPGTLERRGANRQEEVTDISRRVKALADEVSVPVLLLSQLSRAGESRADKRPILSDLRESGSLEQDADLVCFLHRKHHRESGTTQFILEKQRNGDGGSSNLTFTRDTQTFVDGGADLPLEPAPAREAKPRGLRGFGGRR